MSKFTSGDMTDAAAAGYRNGVNAALDAINAAVEYYTNAGGLFATYVSITSLAEDVRKALLVD